MKLCGIIAYATRLSLTNSFFVCCETKSSLNRTKRQVAKKG